MSERSGAKEMPFLDHLEELRWRLLWSIGALIVGTIVGFVAVGSLDLLNALSVPIQPYLTNERLGYFRPSDPFTIHLKLSMSVGVVLASPVLLYQAWSFVAPALYPHEKRVGMMALAGGLVLFCLGVALAYFFVLPASLKFFDMFAGDSLQPMITAPDYFSLVVSLALVFGAAFELPILIVALTALGLVTPTFLRRFRRHAFVMCVVGSALITPGDVITATIALMFPLYGLYELGIILSGAVHRWRERRDAIGDANEAQASA